LPRFDIKKYNKTRRALAEGYLKDLYELFIQPILSLKPDCIDYEQWLAHVFCTADRSILQYEVLKGFTLPDSDKYYVTKGKYLWVRHDKTMPDRFDVEVQTERGHSVQVFRLTELDWVRLKLKVKQVPFKSEIPDVSKS